MRQSTCCPQGHLLNASDFYTAVAEYVDRVDPTWDEERWRAQATAEMDTLRAALGEAAGRAALDCTCGTGVQAIPLARLGWQVTATDVTEAYLSAARRHAREEGLAIDFRTCDLRDLGSRFRSEFDRVVTCMALDNLTADEEIQRAVAGMLGALKPGGRCYVRLRDFDQVMAVRPRYDFKEERRIPHGRVVRLEDWEYESDSHVVNTYIFLREDDRKAGYRWETDVFSYRRRALRKSELERFLRAAGFAQVEFLPQPSPWSPYEVVATRAAE